MAVLPNGLIVSVWTNQWDANQYAERLLSPHCLLTTSLPQQTATAVFSITVNPSASIFAPSTVPGIVDAGADSGVELGVKFTSDVSGNILGIRFYKSSANVGPHVVNLWSSTGTLLATATSTSETASGGSK